MGDLLRPKPFRGDQVAAGTVFLTLFVLLVETRFGGRWSDEVQFLISGGVALFVLAMAVPVPLDGGGPRAYLATLYICSWALTLVALLNLANVFGVDGLPAGTVWWISTTLTALGLFFSRRRDAATGTLLAALAGAVAFAEFVNWTIGIDSVEAFRRVLLLVAVALTITALWQRVRGPAHGVQLLNVVGFVVLAIAVTFAIPIVLGFLFSGGDDGFFKLKDVGAGWGWAALVLAAGVSLVAAGAADAERGNVIVGILNLLAFALLASEGNLIGWPILLLLAAGTLLVIGLRPSTPMPPEPQGGGDDPGPLVTLRPT